MASFRDFWKKEVVEKPGHHIHTAKFDRCVADVKAKGTSDNPYAVCMAVLGDEALKSQTDTEEGMKAAVDAYIKQLNISSGVREKMGINGAGPVPKSLLAEQDLEGETTEKSVGADIEDETEGEEHYRDLADMYDAMADDEARHKRNLETRKGEMKHVIRRLSNGEWGLYDAHTHKLLSHHKTQAKADAALRAIEWAKHKAQEDEGSHDLTIDIINGSEHSSEAEESLDTDEKETLADNIKAIQMKRQRTALRTRATEKSFKDYWRKRQQ